MSTPFPVQPSTAPPSRSQLDDAIRARAILGLRADGAYVEELAGDPDAVARGSTTYGFPLTAEELTVLDGRARNADEVGAVVRAYGAEHPESWAGWYVDTPTGSVIAQFTDNLQGHRQALAGLLNPDARFEIRQARWTAAELKRIRDEVRDSEDWFASLDAQVTALGMPANRNRVTMVVRTERANIVPLILARFDAVGKIEIAFEAPRWAGGRGTLIVTAVDKRGQPVENLDCALDASDIKAVSDLNNLQSTGPDGRCLFMNVGATDIEVSLQGRLQGQVVEFGRGIATVRDGEEVTLPITVTREEFPE